MKLFSALPVFDGDWESIRLIPVNKTKGSLMNDTKQGWYCITSRFLKCFIYSYVPVQNVQFPWLNREVPKRLCSSWKLSICRSFSVTCCVCPLPAPPHPLQHTLMMLETIAQDLVVTIRHNPYTFRAQCCPWMVYCLKHTTEVRNNWYSAALINNTGSATEYQSIL